MTQELEMFSGERPNPLHKFPTALATQAQIDAACTNTTGQVVAIANSSQGQPLGKQFTNLVTITFFHNLPKKQEPLKQCYSMQVDRLRSKEHPKISKIIFQQHTPPSSESPSLVEHMVIATRYGLFVYESTFLLTQKKD